MRANIIAKLEIFRKEQKKAKELEGLEIMWRGVSYYDLCKVEKE